MCRMVCHAASPNTSTMSRPMAFATALLIRLLDCPGIWYTARLTETRETGGRSLRPIAAIERFRSSSSFLNFVRCHGHSYGG